ncbi:helicase-associated domain-containing protein [Arthrobacter sp. MSA 4-2]|uniref:helicase-associated domain-containing protein n=1 Tax=Arthrobacter sp. MSA 4-2 TaxID=2794349 RepID=UPI0018E8645E|nr:helicase-associated domain-containing protein [Arthrobacter sp. MSA 4-2]MBJ2122258.1 helicase-associated domain-containing protein [Arthrobacter sp. MSA 4-2]
MSAIRALADELAARSDSDLRSLLSARPDLSLPPVPDFAALAARASTRASLQRALENLTEPQLQVLEAVLIAAEDAGGTGVDAATLGALLGGEEPPALEPVLAQLTARALLQAPPVLQAGEPQDGAFDGSTPAGNCYVPVGALAEALGPYPAGLGRPLETLVRVLPGFGGQLVEAAGWVRSLGIALGPTPDPEAAARELSGAVGRPADWKILLAAAPTGTKELLERLAGAPVGVVPAAARAGYRAGHAAAPVDWLLGHGLLAPLDVAHVELPRSVGRAVRGHRVAASLQAAPPDPGLRPVRPAVRDNAAHSAVAETLRLVDALLAPGGPTPVATLRSGGVGVREVKRLTEALQVEPAATPWLLELAAGAGLIGLDVDDSRWKPTGAAAAAAGDREALWLALAGGWLDLERAPAMVGTKSPDGATINALAAEASRPDAPRVRRRVLDAAVELTAEHDGATVAGVDAPSLTARLAWHQPRLRRRFERLVPGILAEAEALGLFGGGALTPIGELVQQDRRPEAAAAVREALPAPVSHFVVQADLTAVAPGYLDPVVARELLLLAEPEGRGPATTYRFSPASLRPALDAGQDAASILAFLTRHSATGLPQALTYLVEDTAARYGSLRVGSAGSYLRTEDDAAVEALLADPRAAALGLVKLAPTVVVARAGADELTALLRDLGYTPAPEHPTAPGGAPPPAPAPPSTPSLALPTGPTRTRPGPWSITEEEIAAQVDSLRAGARQAPDRTAGPEGETLLGLETLRAAIRLRSPVRLGTADSQGNAVREVLVPLSVSGGRVRVFDPVRQVEKVVSVHRVMDVEIIEGTSDG